MLTLEDKSFHSADRNWQTGPNLEVVLSYDSDDEARASFLRFQSLSEVLCHWDDPDGDLFTHKNRPIEQLEYGCFILGPANGAFNVGARALAFGARRSQDTRPIGIRQRPQLWIMMPPPQLVHACGLEHFWQSKQPTPASLHFYGFVVDIVRRLHAKQPFVYAKVLDETWGFHGSPKHNPCILVYRKYAEAAGWAIRDIDQGHALIVP